MTITLFDRLHQHHLDHMSDIRHLEKSVKTCTKWQAKDMLTDDEMLVLCNAKIRIWEDMEVFMEYRHWLTADTSKMIPPHQVEQAWETPIRTILDALQIEYKKKHANCYVCGWDSFKKFSFTRNLYFCFWCWIKWNAITLAKDYNGMPFKEAVLWLLKL